jgi:hypothetical protein
VKEWGIAEATSAFACGMEQVSDIYEQPMSRAIRGPVLMEAPHQLTSEPWTVLCIKVYNTEIINIEEKGS